jgi:hypothetical protein
MNPFIDFRNSPIHRYWYISDEKLLSLIRENQNDFLAFIDAIRLVQISFLKNRQFGQQKAFERSVSKSKGPPNVINRGFFDQSTGKHAPLIWTALSGATRDSLGNLVLEKTQIFKNQK